MKTLASNDIKHVSGGTLPRPLVNISHLREDIYRKIVKDTSSVNPFLNRNK